VSERLNISQHFTGCTVYFKVDPAGPVKDILPLSYEYESIPND